MSAFGGGTEEQREEEVRRMIVTAVHSRRPVRAMYQEQERVSGVNYFSLSTTTIFPY